MYMCKRCKSKQHTNRWLTILIAIVAKSVNSVASAASVAGVAGVTGVAGVAASHFGELNMRHRLGPV